MPPLPLFLVSRAFYHDAQAFFFSSNRFIVRDQEPPEDGPPRYLASIFLTKIIPSHCLQYIRFLEISFAPFDKYNPLEDPAWRDWKRSIWLLRDKLNLANLTVRVYMEEVVFFDCSTFRINLTKEQGLAIQRAYWYMTIPLKMWGERGLKHIFVHFPWPWSRTDAWKDFARDAHTGRRPPIDTKESRVERFIMGSDYDSAVCGKNRTTRSEWYINLCDAEEYYWGKKIKGLGDVNFSLKSDMHLGYSYAESLLFLRINYGCI